MTYKEQLSHPKWQHRRLQILERDNFTCQMCFDTENQLQIHHRQYLPDMLAWEYEDEYLVSYCLHCHAVTEYFKKLKSTAIIAVKVFSPTLKSYTITTVFINEFHKYFISVDRYTTNGSIKNIDVVTDERLVKFENLISHAKKLFTNGKV